MSTLLNKGDTVLIHSDIVRTIWKRQITPRKLVQSYLDMVGDNGTVVFPVFFFSWCDGKDFDIRQLNGETGSLGNAALQMGAVRSGNPVYSFAALGRYANCFDMDNHFMLGKDTPFDILLQLNAKVAALDVDDAHCMTLYHHVEKMENAGHRFEKVFPGWYTHKDGYTRHKDYSYFVRNENVETYLKPMEKILWQSGVYQGNKPGVGNGLRVANMREIYKTTAAALKVNGGEGALWRRIHA